jgi:hypothetical protein
MNFRFLHCVAAFGLLVLLGAGWTGCASSQAQVDPSITTALSQAGVSGPTYNKVAAGQRLGFNDILLLVERGVPVHVIESYLQSTQAVYQFSNAQMGELRSAGAPSQLLHYLQETGGFYASSGTASASSSSGEQRAQYLNSPLYQDEQPFAYNAPAVDYWYNSAYEESLYSPFSFNAD